MLSGYSKWTPTFTNHGSGNTLHAGDAGFHTFGVCKLKSESCSCWKPLYAQCTGMSQSNAELHWSEGAAWLMWAQCQEYTGNTWELHNRVNLCGT